MYLRSTIPTRCLPTAGLAVLLGVFGCAGDGGTGPPADDGGDGTTDGRSFSFEVDFEGWEPDATDIAAAMPWSITRSQDLASDGVTSLRFQLVNLNDAGKIWIEQPFTLQPSTTYDVSIEYAFATADYGAFNPWTILTGVLPFSPEQGQDLEPTFQGDTGNGAPSDVGYRWLDKRYQLTAQTGADGLLYLVIGVWGTFEVERSYFVDAVRIQFTER